MSEQANYALRGWRPGEWHHPNCYGCGPDNPRGLHAEFPFDEESGEVRFSFTPHLDLQGAPGYMHGGVISALLDEAQGVLCHHVGHMVMTDRLNLKYHRATPVDKPFRINARLSAVRKRRLYTRAELLGEGDEILVSSSAVFYMFPERLISRMFGTSPENLSVIRAQMETNRRRAREIRKRLRADSSPA